MRLEDYARLVGGRRCPLCGARLPAEVGHYPHGEGWEVEGFQQKQWLYVVCPSCGHECALWKIGISRPRGVVIA
jgi:DNA-directed RNA polymerase subunit RPC12/RpoP